MTEGIARTLVDFSGGEKATPANPLRTDPTGDTTQPISATALPRPAGAATETTLATRATAAQQTDGTQKAIIRGGAKGATPAADITSSHIDANRQGIDTRNYGTGTNDSQQVEGLAPAGSAPVGNPVWVGGHDGILVQALRTILDGTIQRLQAEAKIGKGMSGDGLVHLDAIDTESGRGRLQATLYSPDGDPVSFPSVSSSIKNDFVKAAGSDDLLVDGSVTPVVFEYLADATYDISLQEIKFTLVANSINFGSGYFGSIVGGITNGLRVQVVSIGVTIDVYNLLENEGFVNFSSPGGFEWIVSAKDLLASNYVIGGGLKLHAGTGDKVAVTVRDDIDSAGVYFKCFVKGNLLGV